MSNIPKNLKGGHYWHVVYEGRYDIIKISPKADGFFAIGQDALWGLENVTQWINEINIAYIEEYGEYSYESDYCLTCGSCGETGCCSPNRCIAVVCRYGETNLKDYKYLNDSYETMKNALDEISKHKETVPNCDPSSFPPSTEALIAKQALTTVQNSFPF